MWAIHNFLRSFQMHSRLLYYSIKEGGLLKYERCNSIQNMKFHGLEWIRSRRDPFQLLQEQQFKDMPIHLDITYRKFDVFISVVLSACIEISNKKHTKIEIFTAMLKKFRSVYTSRPTRCTNSYNVSLFIIKCSTCFGLFSPSSGATFGAVYRNW